MGDGDSVDEDDSKLSGFYLVSSGGKASWIILCTCVWTRKGQLWTEASAGSLVPWKNASTGELVQCSPMREYIMVLVTYERIYYVSDEDPTLAKVSSDLLYQTCLMARDGQGMHDGDEGPAVVVADKILFLSHSRSDIEDIPLDGLLGKGMVMNGGLQDFLLPPDLKNTIALSLVS